MPPPPAAAPPAPPPAAAPSQPSAAFRPLASLKAGRPPSEGARLLATQMAVAGASREEILARLHDEFGIDDPGPLVSGILGPGA